MNVTKFGQFIRKLRINKGVNLKEMAESLGVTSSHLSALELGKKNIPISMLDSVTQYFGLSNEEAASLKDTIEESQAMIKIDLKKSSAKDRELASCFARTYQNLDPAKRQKLMAILED
jgi:transcriptional regulator with XRE-family HTH domain